MSPHDIPLGKVERWRFTLYGPSPPHIVHVHAGDFLVLSDPFNPANAGTLKETILLTHAGPVDVAVRFADHRGIFVLHCHMLEHEDRAMMAQFEVTNPP